MWSEGFWKAELWREDKRLQDALSEASQYADLAIQKYVFVTAYIVRKLLEGQALTVELTKHRWPVMVYACTDPPPPRLWFTITDQDDPRERQPLERHYALSTGEPSELTLRDLSNWLVHHFAFEATAADDESGGRVLFNSDHTKDRLFGIDLNIYRQLVVETHYDEVRWVDLRRDENRVVKRRRRPKPDR